MTLTLREALQALLDGKKLRVSTWDPGEYLHLQRGRLLASDGGDCPFIAHWEYELYDGRKHGVKK